ncbi:protein kintoun [Anolis sagrei]|uniref:protein kintoun n=1 Tax=Anolis sagrei TaxID=38937 RepID=UPI003520851A
MSSRPRSSLEDLDLTGEEASRLAQAFQDEEFRRLFAEYAAELSDPAQRAIYEAEVCALERERGVEARFLRPEPGWALRTSQGGSRRCYLNICSNELVGRPEAEAGRGGVTWRLPHCLSPGREELSRGKAHQREPRRSWVYDVLFHPEALRLAQREPRFRELLHQTALEAVEKHYAPQGLDKANASVLRGVKYKGVPQASLLRTPLPQREGGDGDGGEGGPPSPLPSFPTPYAYPPPPPEAETDLTPPPMESPSATTPRWTLRHRSFLDLQDFRPDSTPSTVPRELELSVELPLLRSAAQARLEVRGRLLELDSPKPAAYRLRLTLPYAVDEAAGKATFDKAKRRLVVTLPVLPPPARPFPGEEEDTSGQLEPLPDAEVTTSGPPPLPEELMPLPVAEVAESVPPRAQKPKHPVNAQEEAGSVQPGAEAIDGSPLSSLPVLQKQANSASEATKEVTNLLELPSPANVRYTGRCASEVTETVISPSLPVPSSHVDLCLYEEGLGCSSLPTSFSHVDQCVSEVSEAVSSPSLPAPASHVDLPVSEAPSSPSLPGPLTPSSHVDLCVSEASEAVGISSLPSPVSHVDLPVSEVSEAVITPSLPDPVPPSSHVDLCVSGVSEAGGLSSLRGPVSHVDLCVSEVSEALSSPSLPAPASHVDLFVSDVSEALSSPSLPAPVTPSSRVDLSVSEVSEAVGLSSLPSPVSHVDPSVSEVSEALNSPSLLAPVTEVSEVLNSPSLLASITPVSHVDLCVSEATEAVSLSSLPSPVSHVDLSVSEVSETLNSPSILAPVTPVSHVDLCVSEATEAVGLSSVPAPVSHKDLCVSEVIEALSSPSLLATVSHIDLCVSNVSEALSSPVPDTPIRHVDLCVSNVSEGVSLSSLPAPVSHVDLCVSEASEAVSFPSLPLSSSVRHVGLSASQAGSPSLGLCDLPEESEVTEKVSPPSLLAPHANHVGPQEMKQPTNVPSAVHPSCPPEDPAALSSSPGPDGPPKPTTSPSALLCPPFSCSQDEETVTLLLQVPSVAPQSLQGEGGAHHYRVSFRSQDSASYSILWQFLPENTLAPHKAEISVSPNNVVIVLAKSPETCELWTKLHFGPNADTLQERWFVTENNVEEFLSSLPSASSAVPKEEPPLIEVLDISEDKSQIRLKVKGPRAESGEGGNGCKLSPDAEKGLVESQRASGSLATLATTGQVGKEPSHDPSSSAIPHESEVASLMSKRAPSAPQSQPSSERPTQAGGEEEERRPKAAEDKHRGEDSLPPAVIKETNMQDGSVQYISQHATHCPITFHNALLYELD